MQIQLDIALHADYTNLLSRLAITHSMVRWTNHARTVSKSLIVLHLQQDYCPTVCSHSMDTDRKVSSLYK
jgi:hypothetical protein